MKGTQYGSAVAYPASLGPRRQLWMLEMKSRRFLVSARKRQQFGLAVQFPEKRQTCGCSGAACVLEIARVIRGIFRRIVAAQPFRHNDCRLSRQIRIQKLLVA